MIKRLAALLVMVLGTAGAFAQSYGPVIGTPKVNCAESGGPSLFVNRDTTCTVYIPYVPSDGVSVKSVTLDIFTEYVRNGAAGREKYDTVEYVKGVDDISYQPYGRTVLDPVQAEPVIADLAVGVGLYLPTSGSGGGLFGTGLFASHWSFDGVYTRLYFRVIVSFDDGEDVMRTLYLPVEY
ncbi:MAG TPA: hypothetical protein VHN99_02215 [Deinococcales bacterium]|nr:hypothetical protein [Deinococcales bacterium]